MAHPRKPQPRAQRTAIACLCLALCAAACAPDLTATPANATPAPVVTTSRAIPTSSATVQVSGISATATAAASATPSATTTPIPSSTPKPTPTASQTPFPASRVLSGFIAFVSNRYDHSEIYLYDADRNEVIQWTNDDAPKRNPEWAPDGHTLVYSAMRDGTWQIYKKSLSGGREIKLTSAPGDNYEPAWSPDGKAIAFTSNRDGREQIYLMDAEGRNLRSVSHNAFSDFGPSWSPDGKWLVFSTNRDGNWQIYVGSPDGTNARNLSHSTAGDWSPAWSPDGTRIAFVSDRDGREQVYAMGADGSGPVNLSKSTASDWSPAWSGDAQRMTFVSKRDGNFELYMLNADGTGLRRLTNDLGDDVQPAWREEPGAAASVRVPAIPASNPRTDDGPKMVTLWHFDDNPKIDGMRSSTLQALGQNETAYAVPSGQVFGFEPGDDYPQFYIRDLSWMDLAAMYYYPPQYLRDATEEFLRRQYTGQTPLRPNATGTFPGDGAIPGYFSPDTPYDKHTTTSDEETNLIRAAYTYWSASGDNAWLKKDVNGQTVIARLNKAMEWVFANRLDRGTSLIWRAHTTDWGDVKIEKTGSPTEWQPGDTVTASIFDQAMAYQALRNLAAMNAALDDRASAERYNNSANDLEGQVEKYLWQPTKGFYKTHWHLTPLTHNGFDEDAIVSSSNALMLYTGLSDRYVVLDRLDEAAKAIGAIKPGLSLFPPYPAGVFAYVQMAEGMYQNGGLWDWWGGTQITAEFESGYRARALSHLYEVADDWSHHPRDIYEWQLARTGVNKGSDDYGGSVATMNEAVVRGLYGIRLDAQSPSISPRLAEHNGWIRAYVPASGLFASYQYSVKGPLIHMQFETNVKKDLPFRVALPAGSGLNKVSIDGQAAAFRVDHYNEDDYAIFSVPTGTHTIDITYK